MVLKSNRSIFLSGVVIGALGALAIVSLVSSSPAQPKGQREVSDRSLNELAKSLAKKPSPVGPKATQPLVGEPGYNPETMGYPALLGKVKEIKNNEVIFTSVWCFKKGCDASKEHEYRATITPKTMLKRFIQKSKKEFESEIAARKKSDPPPNLRKETPLDLTTVKKGEDIRVLIEKIIDDSSIVAREVSIFEPAPSLQAP